jgi:hypothetical protein
MKKSKPEKLMLKVIKGGFAPTDNYTTQKLRSRKYGIGDIIAAQLTKPRNPKFWRMAHSLGALVAENIESFAGMDSHLVIKRLQREALIGCDEFMFNVPGCGMITQYIPRSLSFESMSAEEFDEVYAGICRHIISTYWPTETTAQLEEMALMMETQL